MMMLGGHCPGVPSEVQPVWVGGLSTRETFPSNVGSSCRIRQLYTKWNKQTCFALFYTLPLSSVLTAIFQVDLC